jgi:hypothetical protein
MYRVQPKQNISQKYVVVPDSFLLVPGVGAQEEVFRSM